MGTTVEELHTALQDIIGTSHITVELSLHRVLLLPANQKHQHRTFRAPSNTAHSLMVPQIKSLQCPQDQVQAHPPGATSVFLYTKPLQAACVPAR